MFESDADSALSLHRSVGNSTLLSLSDPNFLKAGIISREEYHCAVTYRIVKDVTGTGEEMRSSKDGFKHN